MRQEVLWFYGADAVGKSVVGWEAYRQLVDGDVPAAYVDTDHLGFCHPRPDDPVDLVAANLRAVWANFDRVGARWLVVSGILVTVADRDRFEAVLGEARLTTCLLRAQPATIRSRILRRRELEADEQATTLPPHVLRELDAYGERSVRFAASLEAGGGGFADLVLDTDQQTPAAVAERAVAHLRS